MRNYAKYTLLMVLQYSLLTPLVFSQKAGGYFLQEQLNGDVRQIFHQEYEINKAEQEVLLFIRQFDYNEEGLLVNKCDYKKGVVSGRGRYRYFENDEALNDVASYEDYNDLKYCAYNGRVNVEYANQDIGRIIRYGDTQYVLNECGLSQRIMVDTFDYGLQFDSTSFAYNANCDLILETRKYSWDPDIVTETKAFKYDEQGRLLEIVKKMDGILFETEYNEYDENDVLRKKMIKNFDGAGYIFDYHYHENGDMISEKLVYSPDTEGEFVKYDHNHQYIQPDDHNNWTSRLTYENAKLVRYAIRIISYYE